MYLGFEIKCFTLMNWLWNSDLPNKKQKPVKTNCIPVCQPLWWSSVMHSRICPRHRSKMQLLSLSLSLWGETAFMLQLNYWILSLKVAVEDIQG